MSDSVKKLLHELGENPEVLERFRDDPDAVMEEFRIEPDHRKLILDGDKEQLMRITGADEDEARMWIL